jgi:hypothetical protein
MRLDAADDIVFVVWNDAAEMLPRLRLPHNELLSVSNIFGEPIVAKRDEVILEETMGPLYVCLKRR